MIDTIFFFLAAALLTNFTIGCFGYIFISIRPAYKNWPAFWVSLMIISVFVPAFGAILTLFPRAVPAQGMEFTVLHPLLSSLPFAKTPPTSSLTTALPIDLHMLGFIAISFYAIGCMFGLMKLIIGRARIRNIIANGRATAHEKHSYHTSSIAQTAFAWTPFLRPHNSHIIIPEKFTAQLTPAEISLIINHECGHIDRRDDEVGLVLRVLKIVFWPSVPFAWMFANWCQACEVQCDRAVTIGGTHQMREAYAHVLLKALHITANRVLSYPAASFSTNRLRKEKMRITHIMSGNVASFKQAAHRYSLLVAASCLTVLGAVTYAQTATADEQTSQANSVTMGGMITGRVTSRFGPAKDPFNEGKPRNHKGIDIGAPNGTPIYAPANGVILSATNIYQNKPNYGYVIVIETKGGVQTLLSHLGSYDVKAGQVVRKGEKLAEIGVTGKTTGPHVHIETRREGTLVDPETVWPLSN